MTVDTCKVLMIFPALQYRFVLELSCGLRIDRGALSGGTAWLVDCNTETLTEADLEWGDLVMTGGMNAVSAA